MLGFDSEADSHNGIYSDFGFRIRSRSGIDFGITIDSGIGIDYGITNVSGIEIDFRIVFDFFFIGIGSGVDLDSKSK